MRRLAHPERSGWWWSGDGRRARRSISSSIAKSAVSWSTTRSSKDIVEHFAQSMEDFWADPSLNTCKNCGTPNGKPTPVKRITFEPEVKIERE
jgi:hypothetical protein